jgi:predicted helicase
LFQAVAARDPQHSDTLRKTAIESALEKFRQDAQLLYACGTHVTFIIF